MLLLGEVLDVRCLKLELIDDENCEPIVGFRSECVFNMFGFVPNVELGVDSGFASFAVGDVLAEGSFGIL